MALVSAKEVKNELYDAVEQINKILAKQAQRITELEAKSANPKSTANAKRS